MEQKQESFRYAWRTFHRLYQLVDEHYNLFHPGVIKTFRDYEKRELEEVRKADEIAITLHKAGKEALVREYLTKYCNDNALNAFRLANMMANCIEEQTRLITPPDDR